MNKRIRPITFLLMIALVITMALPNQSTVYASSVKKASLSTKRVTMCISDKKTIRMRNTTSNVTWSIKNKSIAKIKVSGKNKTSCKITALSSGTTTLSAKVGKKTYKCTIKVNAPTLESDNVILDIDDDTDVTFKNVRSKLKWEVADKEKISIETDGKYNETVTIKGLKSGNTIVKTKYLKKTYYIRCEIKEQPVIPHNEHSWNLGTIIKENSCGVEGEIEYKCSECDEKKIEKLTALEHIWSDIAIEKNPTCTDVGYESQYCLICNSRKVDIIPVLEHTYEETYTIDILPTCTETGKESRHCIRCSASTDTNIIPSTGHIKDTVNVSENSIIKQPTCIEKGVERVRCSDCEGFYEETLPITDHSFNESVVSEEPNCIKDGNKVYTCSVCSITKDEPIKHLGHIGKDGICTRDDCHMYCAGIYDTDGNMIMNWEDLQNKYNVNIENNTSSMSNCLSKFEQSEVVIYTDDVKKIGNGKFKNCNKIRKVIFADNVELIGDDAFEGCTNLEEIVFTEKSVLKTLGSSSFNGCSKLNNVTLPNTLEVIGEQAFDSCSTLNNIVLNDGLLKIKEGAFKNCIALPNVTLPNTVNELGKDAYNSCLNLASVTLSNNLNSLSDSTFEGCSKLKTFDFNGAEIITLGNGLFQECNKLESITLPNTVSIIKSKTFLNCTNLKSVVLSDELLLMDDLIFRNCNSSLTVTYKGTVYNDLNVLNELLKEEGITSSLIY